MVHSSQLCKNRKDPKGKKFHPICKTCDDCFLEQQLLEPFWESLVPLKESMDLKEELFQKLLKRNDKLDSEIYEKKIKLNQILKEKGEKQFKAQNNKGGIDSDMTKIMTEISNLISRDNEISKEIEKNSEKSELSWSKFKQMYFLFLYRKSEKDKYNKLAIELDDELIHLEMKMDKANRKIKKLKLELLDVEKCESIFSNNYHVTILNHEDRNTMVSSKKRKKLGDKKMVSKPSCQSCEII